MPKVSNVTNSSDPQLINSRVFVGNLNTFVVSKEDVERIFKRYGQIYGISMHKGYTFVQFCNEYDARNAVAGEEGRIVAGQPLDVNMASEPKPNRPNRGAGTAAAATTGNWDFYYEGGYNNAPQAMHGPPLKRARPGAVRRELVTVRPRGKSGQTVQKQPLNITGEIIEYNVSDVVICGNCKEQFADLHGMLTHRKSRCKMRFACKCQDVAEKTGPFHCVSCSEVFVNLRDAVFHAQSIHDVKVVVEELSKEKKEAVKQENDIGDSAGNHEGEVSSDSHNILESGDGNNGEGEMENDGDGGGDDDAILQDDAEGGEAAE